MEMLDIAQKKTKLLELYREFSDLAGPRIVGSVCRSGCSDCCTTVGNVDATTLEGFLLLEEIGSRTLPERKELGKRLKQNRREREKSAIARCAFLGKDNTCAVYGARPFSCRRLYSLVRCGESGPTVHRDVWELAGSIESSIMALDDTGYSGHLSHILQLFGNAAFRATYLGAGFDPDAVRDFALKHDIVVNRFAEQARFARRPFPF
jgi:hypothetical protein